MSRVSCIWDDHSESEHTGVTLLGPQSLPILNQNGNDTQH